MRWALLLLALGCVPKGRYELTRVQLDATRTALSAQAARSIADATAADEARAALEREIALRQAQLDELSARALVRDAELDRLQRERLELLDELTRLRAELEAARAELAKRTRSAAPAALTPSLAEVLAGKEVQDQVQAQFHAQLEHDRAAVAVADTHLAFAALVEAGSVALVDDGDVVVVRVPTHLLFQEGFATLSPRGQALMGSVVEALRAIPGRSIMVEGHTDDRKVHTAQFPSNWERAFSNALAVLRAVEGAGLDARLAAASLADTRPVAPNDTPEGRRQNERIELRITLDPDLPTRFAPTPADAPPDPPTP